jgi:hypothetical protein
MSTGPEPHSIPYDAELFRELAMAIEDNNEVLSLKPTVLMNKIGMMDLREHGEIKLFFCGYGVVGKGWGFAYGDLTETEIEDPSLVERNGVNLGLTYLKKIDHMWYRFAAG